MEKNKSITGIVFDIFNAILMIALFVIMLYPFVYVLNYSLSSPGKVGNSLLLIPI